MFNCLEWTSSYLLCWATGIAKIGWKKQKSWPAGNLQHARVLVVGFIVLGWVFFAICKLFECLCFTYLLRYVRIQINICSLLQMVFEEPLCLSFKQVPSYSGPNCQSAGTNKEVYSQLLFSEALCILHFCQLPANKQWRQCWAGTEGL